MQVANCFDITDACMSWIRATHIAQLMLQAGTCKRVMIINGEFHLGFHDNWEIRDLGALEYSFPMCTIGEAATATILIPSEEDWEFAYSSKPEFFDLCTIPLPSHGNFVEDGGEKMGHNGIYKFVSYGKELLQAGVTCLGELIRNTIDDVERNVWYFPHAPSKRIYEENMPKYGVPAEKVYLKVYPQFGNLVSASIPVGLALGKGEGTLKPGDSIALVPVSAGLVAAVVQLTF